MNGRLEKSMYHSLLRISVCVFALVVLFDSGLLTKSTASLSTTAQDYVASAVGVKVSVAPNDVNILTARITELEREVASKDREIAVNLSTGSEGEIDRSTFVLSIILFILLVLIVLNYALDFVRSRTEFVTYKTPLSKAG
jgi:hypothetical protein